MQLEIWVPQIGVPVIIPPDARMGTSVTLRACCFSRDSPFWGAGNLGGTSVFFTMKTGKVTCGSIKIEDFAQ